MKTIYTLFLLICSMSRAVSQSNEDYYNPVTAPVKPNYEPVIPDINHFKKTNREVVFAKIGQPKIRNRLYFGLDGFVRTDKAGITNTFDGLIDTRTGSKAGWSASLGWVHQEKWMLELEYSRSPIHNILVINGDYPMEYKVENDKNNLALRAKRRLLFGKSNSSLRRSAFWIGTGAGIVPNSGKQKEYLEFEGYSRQRFRPRPDTLFLTSDSKTSSGITGFADVTAEYVIKVARAIDLSIYARKQWGLGNSLTTDLAYFVNKVQTAESTIKADGSGMTFGISLRYVFALGYDEGRQKE